MKNKELTEIEKEIKGYDRYLKRHSDDSNTYAQKAAAILKQKEILVSLGEKNAEDKLNAQILECYNQAIEHASGASVYLVDRSKVHVAMGRPDLAALDITQAQQSPETGDKILDMYMCNTTRNILKLSNVRDEVSKLIKDNKLPPEIGEVFSNMIQVIADIDLRVSEHNGRLNEHDKKLEDYEARLKKMEEALSSENKLLILMIRNLQKEMQDIREKSQAHEQEINKHEQVIHEIQKQIINLVSQDAFTELSKKLSNPREDSLFEGRLKLVEGKLDNHDELFMTINDTLKQTNIYKEQQIKEDFEKLKIFAPNEVLYKYANSFSWALSNYLLAYRAIGTKMVAGEREKGKFEEMWNKVGGTVMNIVGAVPVVGGILPLIENGLSLVNDTYQGLKFDRKVEKINSIITKSVLEKDLSLAVASSAIQIALNKQSEIIAQEKGKSSQPGSQNAQLTNLTDKIMIKFNEKVDEWLTKSSKVTKTEITPAEAMAVKDVILFINYIATHDDAIKVEERGQELDKSITEIMFSQNLLEVPQGQNQGNQDSSKSGSKSGSKQGISKEGSKESDCIISKIDQIVYDNPLLNHPDLLKIALKSFGSKAIELSSKLPLELIEKAAASQMVAKVAEMVQQETGSENHREGEARYGEDISDRSDSLSEGEQLLLAGLMSLELSEGNWL